MRTIFIDERFLLQQIGVILLLQKLCFLKALSNAFICQKKKNFV